MRKTTPLSIICFSALLFGCSDDTTNDDDIGDTDTDATGDDTTGDGEGESSDTDSSSSDTETDAETETDTTDTTDTSLDPFCGDGNVDAGEECDDGNDVDTDTCTNACAVAICGDGIVQEGVEGCDDGNAADNDGCTAACVIEGCGDGIVQAMEQCDDANDIDSDECTTLCAAAACGDGFVQEGVEQCDDANDVDSDACLPSCVDATCGDGFVLDGMEECDDANDVDTDECLNACTIATCGDGVVHDGIENCDDGNIDPNDGCSPLCAIELKPNLLRCGGSQRDVADFIPIGVNLTVVASCTPDANTQAMLVTRNGVGQFNAAALKTWVEGGGIVITEVFASDDVYNAVFNAGVGEVGFFGGCQDTAPTVVQYSPMDQFWVDNLFQAIMLGQSGCGRNVAGYPMITPLSGWSMTEVSIGYRNAGAGRVWVAEFDWQDSNTIGAAYDYTESLMGYMITNGQ